MTDSERYIQAARRKFSGDPDIAIYDNAIIDNSPNKGFWVSAQLWVNNDELESGPGPTYVVRYSELLSDESGFSQWQEDSRFTFDDDPDGNCARLMAHRRARELRNQFDHCAYVSVKESTSSLPSIPWNPYYPDPDFRDFSSSCLGL